MDTQTPDASRQPERGASAVEYGLLIVGIAAVVALAVYALGDGVFFLFDDSCTKMAAEQGKTC